jgi:hypothetical protein
MITFILRLVELIRRENSSTTESRGEKLVKLGQQNDPILIAAGGMHNDPGTGCSALIRRRMRNVRWYEDLLSSFYGFVSLQTLTVMDHTFAV